MPRARSTRELVDAFRYSHPLTETERATLRALAEDILSASAQGWPLHHIESTDDLDL
jgi:hypothetical protein